MKKVTILIVVFASLVGVGLLGNLITLDIQPFGIFGSLSEPELEGSKCSCNDGNGNYDPANCQDFGGIYTDTNGVCVGIAPAQDYGIPPSEDQGCSATFWAANADSVVSVPVWPLGYGPDNYYNQMFQTTIQFSDLAETVEEDKVDDQENGSAIGTNESSDENKSVVEDVETGDVEAEDNSADVETEASSADVETEDSGEEVDVETSGEEVDVETIDDQRMTEEQTSEETLVENAAVSEDNKNGLKLSQALQLKEGKLDLLIRESVAAMLNAAHPQIHYPLSVADIMKMTQIAISTGDYDETMNVLKNANGIGNSPLCPSSSLLVSP